MVKNKNIFIIITIIINTIIFTSQSFTASLSYPFLLTNVTFIDYITPDYFGNYLVQFGNGTLVKFNSTFTSASIMNLP